VFWYIWKRDVSEKWRKIKWNISKMRDESAIFDIYEKEMKSYNIVEKLVSISPEFFGTNLTCIWNIWKPQCNKRFT